MILKVNILLIIVLTSFYACQESYYYNQSREIVSEGWEPSDIIDFPFAIIDTLQSYRLILDVQHLTSYDYQNLYVKIDTRYPDLHIVSDTLSFNLANKMGDWNGKCSGNTCNLNVFLTNGIRFEQKGKYSISFSPYSRLPKVKDIKKISLKLQEVEKTVTL